MFPLGLLSQGGGAPSGPSFVLVGTANQMRAWSWNASTGFGTVLSTAPSITSQVNDIRLNAAKTNVFIAMNSDSFIQAYPWSPSTYFGSKFADPATLPPNSSFGITTANNNVAVVHATTPFITAYPFTSGWGTKYADPSQTAENTGRRVDFNTSGNTVVGGFTRQSSVSVAAWGFSSGFGTRTVNSSYLVNNVWGVKFNPAGNVIATASDTNPQFLSAFPWSAGFGTKFTDPSSQPVYPLDLRWSPSGDTVVGTEIGSPYIAAFPFSSGWGTRYANPASLATGTGNGLDFSSSGNAIAMAHNTTPFISAYAWSSGFGTKYANPATLPNSNAVSVAFV